MEKSAARRIVRDIERSIVHYGDTTLFIADQMRKEGTGYASAVAMEEVTLLEFSRNRGPQPKLIALYPPEGTFYSDNRFIVLNGSWVSAAQRQGAERFGDFLAEEVTPSWPRARDSGQRTWETAPVPPSQGERRRPRAARARAGPAQSRERSTASGGPGVRTVKPANVLLVVDTSGSMADENRLVQAKRASRPSSRRSAGRTAWAC